MANSGLVRSGCLILEDKAKKVCFDVQLVLCSIYKHENKMNMTRLQEITPVNSARKSREGSKGFLSERFVLLCYCGGFGAQFRLLRNNYSAEYHQAQPQISLPKNVQQVLLQGHPDH